jgi:hypothetical protein
MRPTGLNAAPATQNPASKAPFEHPDPFQDKPEPPLQQPVCSLSDRTRPSSAAC